MNTITVQVSRGSEKHSEFQTFEVPEQENQTVLDLVTYIQEYIDPTLSYRFACRVGMCGSCGMMVNGEPRWTCRTHVKKVLGSSKTIEVGDEDQTMFANLVLWVKNYNDYILNQWDENAHSKEEVDKAVLDDFIEIDSDEVVS